MDETTKKVMALCSICGTGISKGLAAIGVTSWSEMSALLTCIVSILFIADWVWKKWKNRK